MLTLLTSLKIAVKCSFYPHMNTGVSVSTILTVLYIGIHDSCLPFSMSSYISLASFLLLTFLHILLLFSFFLSFYLLFSMSSCFSLPSSSSSPCQLNAFFLFTYFFSFYIMPHPYKLSRFISLSPIPHLFLHPFILFFSPSPLSSFPCISKIFYTLLLLFFNH